ncbi:MAG: ferrochelatase [Polyangiaceae bacterium]|jgi:ferrochelatase|nr:ferrochelatase [Polyangiaceae bacterium]
MPDTGVLLVAHGTPSSLDDIAPFLKNIRRGRPTPPDIVEAVRGRYAAIGGRSPLLDTTREQASKLSARLGLPAFVATRMWHPYFEDVLRSIAEEKLVDRLVVLVMAPHSAHVYEAALRDSARGLLEQGLQVPALQVAPCWGDEPALVDAWAGVTRATLDALNPGMAGHAVLVPTAHSLPMRTVRAGDPYPGLVAATADAVMQRLGADAMPSILCFQSQGMSQEPWLGPDLPTVFRRAASTGASGVVVVPIGFLVDHVETLYDLDIEARQLAEHERLWFARVPCLNASDALIDAAERVLRRLL